MLKLCTIFGYTQKEWRSSIFFLFFNLLRYSHMYCNIHILVLCCLNHLCLKVAWQSYSFIFKWSFMKNSYELQKYCNNVFLNIIKKHNAPAKEWSFEPFLYCSIKSSFLSLIGTINLSLLPLGRNYAYFQTFWSEIYSY
jgi:hypothetical protein